MMTETKWKSLLRSLPEKLSYAEAARRLKLPYQSVRLAIIRHQYLAMDGRRFGKNGKRRIPVEEIDWTHGNADIARGFGVSRERIRVIRKQLGIPFVESRGRKKI